MKRHPWRVKTDDQCKAKLKGYVKPLVLTPTAGTPGTKMNHNGQLRKSK